jgi:hypothetical protein
MHMTTYRIKELGSAFILEADGQDVLICENENIVRAIMTDVHAPIVPFHQRPENFIGPVVGLFFKNTL